MKKSKSYYQYNPHHHVKIWFSNSPQLFMNDENQMRLIAMRYNNPNDTIHLVYDSSLLEPTALQDLYHFCHDYRIIPCNVAHIDSLLKTNREKKLYEFYKDEITHLDAGGNLAVASDIIRWLAPVYLLGTYTDFDVPVDTSTLSETLMVDSPLLLNIGSLKIRSREVILSNNDYIAVIDAAAAQVTIERIQDVFIQILTRYTNDFIEKTEEELFGNSFINKKLLYFLRNRSESIYIVKSKEFQSRSEEAPQSSRELRGYINEMMQDETSYLDFHKLAPDETTEALIRRLKDKVNNQLGMIKRVFFNQEYRESKHMLNLSNTEFLKALMKKERSLYLKSIVVCTTGPIAIARALFHGYVFNSTYIKEQIRPYSLNTYGLRAHFQSKNALNLHDNVITMLYFLGAGAGELNDLSWLEEGSQLQVAREKKIQQRKKICNARLSYVLRDLKTRLINQHSMLVKQSEGFLAFYRRDEREFLIPILSDILSSFGEGFETEFDLKQFRNAVNILKSVDCSRSYFNKTWKLIQELDHCLCEATILGLSNQGLKQGVAAVSDS